jgi:hypothetical protein
MSEIRMKPYNNKYGEEYDRIFRKKFEIICDETNNSQKDIDENRINATVVILKKTPLYDDKAEYATDQSTDEVNEQ